MLLVWFRNFTFLDYCFYYLFSSERPLHYGAAKKEPKVKVPKKKGKQTKENL